MDKLSQIIKAFRDELSQADFYLLSKPYSAGWKHNRVGGPKRQGEKIKAETGDAYFMTAIAKDGSLLAEYGDEKFVTKICPKKEVTIAGLTIELKELI